MEAVTMNEELRAKTLAILGTVGLFEELSPSHLEKVLEMVQVVRLQPGEALVKQGDPADSFFLIMEGVVGIVTERSSGERALLAHMNPPCTIGEIGLLLNKPRTASVIAEEDTLALLFSGDVFLNMFIQNPQFGLGITRGLARRLESVSGQMPIPTPSLDEIQPGTDLDSLLPIGFLQRHRVLPLALAEDRMTLGFVDTPTSAVLHAVYQLVPGREVVPVSITLQAFESFMRSRAGLDTLDGTTDPLDDEPPPGRIEHLDTLLDRMRDEGASDLHLVGGCRPRWRVDGDLCILEDLQPLAAEEVHGLLEPCLEERHRLDFETHHDVDFIYIPDNGGRFRVNMYRNAQGIAAAFRLLPTSIVPFDQLRIPKVVKSFCSFPKGLVLVTGPTGSGKSTTLAAMIDVINQNRPSHVITLEDPIEFVHRNHKALINQREVGGHTSSFARALRAAFREDPDVILVGEVRDRETLDLAMEAANTGHLVLSSMHTNSVVSTVDRIIDMYPSDQQNKVRVTLSEVLKGVVSQTLCKLRNGGRLGVFEVMIVNRAIANMIREGKTIQIPTVMQTGKRDGHTLQVEELANLVKHRKIDFEEALSKTPDKEDLAERLGRSLPNTM